MMSKTQFWERLQVNEVVSVSIYLSIYLSICHALNGDLINFCRRDM
jgi:hypothetical protein